MQSQIGQGGNEQALGPGGRAPRRTHIVRQEHVQTIQAMFPDIPEAAIRADLARTGSPAITSDNILRNGGTLPLPPATRAEQRAEVQVNSGARTTTSSSESSRAVGSSSGVMLNTAYSPLVNRVRVSKDSDSKPLPEQPPKTWEADSEKRAEILRQRKEFMLLEARKRYLEKKAKSSAVPGKPESDVAAGPSNHVSAVSQEK
ncbi:hypothetical protein LPJ78_000964 [Coemansia sp. RSA 989]|nr:hypothetical protein LPJ68_005160 [Coemansia sp. RSA 1086]KAJ1752841.1 hypothetical protein LPJ79_000828 [Coemansia sp. RSA 1821]KAJ1867554.1 hypothetical protein LPJ78_000964 [Coemansia sp. RSA 989]KAJ2650950.1 hypothetical protein IWW40_001969 [Coemansia sp. RSA 1250]